MFGVIVQENGTDGYRGDLFLTIRMLEHRSDSKMTGSYQPKRCDHSTRSRPTAYDKANPAKDPGTRLGSLITLTTFSRYRLFRLLHVPLSLAFS